MSQYEVKCAECGHDASVHPIAGRFSDGGFAGWECAVTAASLYAKECARLDADLTRTAEDRITAERERDAVRADIQAYRDALGYGFSTEYPAKLCDGSQPINAEADAFRTEMHKAMSERDAARAECERLKREAAGIGSDLIPASAVESTLADLTAARALAARYEKVARFLFGVLDDIDTADDMAKADETLYRSLVRRYHAKRFLVATTDGYTLTWLDDPAIPVAAHSDDATMAFNADARTALDAEERDNG